jgi:Met-zincin/Domain of unknown function (DUF5117)/Domain of unknown function (DUF5118)
MLSSKVISIFCLTLAFTQIHAQIIRPGSPTPDTAKKDSVKPDPRSIIKPYWQVITPSYTTKEGLFTVHECKDTVYFEIPDSILNRDIEVINRLSAGPGGTGVYAGEVLDEKTIQFEHNLSDSTIRIRYDLVISSADTASDIYKAVKNSNENPVAFSFPIKAYNYNHSAYVIDMTKWLKDAKSFVNTVSPDNAFSRRVTGFHDFDLDFIHVYPINVEISITKNAESHIPGLPQGTPATLTSISSFVELPLVPMQQRIADPRVGYFADQEYHFGDDQQRVEDRRFILRWRLEPRDEDRDRWLHGELVEPKKPIIIYIDPATPKQWRPYLIAGINDWQKAFEQAGFKNAIFGREWPEGDTTMHMDDARYSFVNYLPSEITNAYGPQIHDPRSGEIIQTKIGWYHNVMELLHDWYMIQAGAVDPRARHPKFDDALMGQLIRFVSSHEVGHTLGLRHNMGASSRTPVDSLRSRHYLALHGHTSSIMDYARFDYVAQPEDNIPENELFPHIGEYDRWAIQWGYMSAGGHTAEQDKIAMRKLVTDSLAANTRLWFGADNRETGRKDPRCQSEDLGDDAVKASAYGIMNLKRILPNLPAWTHEEGGTYDQMNEMYQGLKDQFTRYMQQVILNIGGVYTTPRGEDEKGAVYTPTPATKQAEAVAFFNKELFTTPTWLLDERVTRYVSEPTEPNFVEDLQVRVLNSLLDIGKIDQVLAVERQFPDQAYKIEDYFAAIHKGIWSELKTGKTIDPYRRNLQKSYIASIQNILLSTKADQTESDAFSLIRADILQLQSEINADLPRVTDAMTRYHLQDLQVRIKKTLDANPVIQ